MIGSPHPIPVDLAARLAAAALEHKPARTSPFRSFWMGGYEGADHLNEHGCALDMAALSGHVEQLEDDHRRAAELGIRTLRESIGWRLAEPAPGCFDLRRALRIASSARNHGLQVIWSLMHYGTPADVSLIDDDPACPGNALSERFAAFAAAVARALAPFSDTAPIYNPINEIGFIAWAVSQSNLLHPYRGDPTEGDPQDGTRHGHALGYAVKRRLVHAALRGLEAMRQVDPRARFLHVEPLIHVAAPHDRPDLDAAAAEVSSYQWQTWDMLGGLTEPQLGGSVDALDLIGVNHYHNSQWQVPGDQRLWWHLRDPRRAPFAALLGAAWQRYRRPLIVAETSHFGDGRAAWLDEIADEVTTARAAGVPVDGLCLYPLVDRPDWSDITHWHRSGLWDVADDGNANAVAARVMPAQPPRPDAPPTPATPTTSPALRRVLCADYAQALTRWQAQLPAPGRALLPGSPKPWLVVLSQVSWDGLWQRPQQLMTRLSRHFRVLFIEAPQASTNGSADAAPVRLERVSCGPDMTRLVAHAPSTHAPGTADGFDAEPWARLAPALATFMQEHAITDPVAWVDTPRAWALLAGLRPCAVFYDCAVDLGGARDGDAALLHRADLVLTRGPSLHAAKRLLHPQRQLIANAVDAAHFDPAALDPHSHDGRETRVLLARFSASPGPRIGYAGAIDEQLDLELLAQLADARPQWQFVLVGPVCATLAAGLPQRPNLHWLGLQPYARLPHLYASWDVCMLPLALNEATRCANPLQLLEFMAAGKSVVSTALPDALALHGTTVQFASDRAGFVAACEQALAQTAPEREHRARRMADTVRANDWDARVEEVLALLQATLARLAASVTR